MWIRKRFDIAWRDMAFAVQACLTARNPSVTRQRIEQHWCNAHRSFACLSVRTGFDLALQALAFPRGSEILLSAITIPDMARIVEHHGLVPVPVDLDLDEPGLSMQSLRQATSGRSRALVVAHLFGGRMTMAPLIEFARQHGLVVIEDCAQSFDGGGYCGHAEADISMFSFGPIKSATALGGAILHVQSLELHRRICAIEAQYPRQPRRRFAFRILKYAALKGLSTPRTFGALTRILRLLGKDYDRIVRNAARGFGDDNLLIKVRHRPSAPLLALLLRRLRGYDGDRAASHAGNARRLARRLGPEVCCPGGSRVPHTFWVFPVLVNRPSKLARTLRLQGYDAATKSSLFVVPPPAQRPELVSRAARHDLNHLVFLPLYPEMPARALDRMARVVRQHVDRTGRLARRPCEGNLPQERIPAAELDGQLVPVRSSQPDTH